METKKPWQSKTMVLNGVIGLIMFVCLFVPQAEVAKLWIDAHAAELGMGWAVLGMLLRTISKDKIVLGE